MFSFQGTSELNRSMKLSVESFIQRLKLKVVGQSGLDFVAIILGFASCNRSDRTSFVVDVPFVPFSLCENGGPKWTRTTDLTIISRVL